MRTLVDGSLNLPEAIRQSFWINGSAWQFPDYANAETFVDKLVREGLLVHEPIVDAALRGQLQERSLRSIQRRFLQATGLTHSTILWHAQAVVPKDSAVGTRKARAISSVSSPPSIRSVRAT